MPRENHPVDERGFFRTIVGDGTPLLLAVAGSLVFSGGFAIFLAATGEFLPHDIHYLGMSADDLCRIARCRVVDFMLHDRAAFGGALVALGILYTWLIAFPLRAGRPWAWTTLLVTGGVGFATFLAYIGYGYLDTWHGIGTLLLLPAFGLGMARARRLLDGKPSLGGLVLSEHPLRLTSPAGIGRVVLLLGAAGTVAGGATILKVGMFEVFVPEDLAFMGITSEQLQAANTRLVPLLAHDRAGFGGAVLTLGLTTTLALWHAPLRRDLWEAVAAAGIVSLSAAVGTHFFVGYTDVWHLAPPFAAIASLVVGLGLAVPRRNPAAPVTPRRPP
jgi:hypothetical protein